LGDNSRTGVTKKHVKMVDWIDLAKDKAAFVGFY